MEKKSTPLADYFGENLANLLGDKIANVYNDFDKQAFVKYIRQHCQGKSLTQRVGLIADRLRLQLPAAYPRAIAILMKIMGDENPNQTGMFKEYYWLMPVGKFIEKYGLDHFDKSIHAIEELTKRNTGEYAIRPFIRRYPKETLKQMKVWARSDNFHLRRLASEGLRPKLPWTSKLDLFIENPKPVFQILNLMKMNDEKFRWLPSAMRNALLNTYARGLEVILDCQIAINDRKTAWCQQHDFVTHKPYRAGPTNILLYRTGEL